MDFKTENAAVADESKYKYKRILTGDRPTGPLHLGHYAGSLKNRVRLQAQYETFILIADIQALTTNFEHPEKLRENIFLVALDYLSAGIDPKISTIAIQSMIPEISELTTFFSMLISVNPLRHNPTIKTEAKERGYKELTYGFLGYPVSQTADIAIFKADLVPVGIDQLPHIELARKIIRKFNELYCGKLVEPYALIDKFPKLVGLDGNLKMSKSYGNAINLSDDFELIKTKIKSALTDKNRIHPTDKGNPEICTIYSYHKAFSTDTLIKETEYNCKNGKIGCVKCKENLLEVIKTLLEPMNERRAYYLKNKDEIWDILFAGTKKAKITASEIIKEVKESMKILYPPI
ncbi:MAG: tryptophan--tRNA ligase [Deltaproteobacteria bacterium]|nr:tryptophan--tRNA ligase [Deltaproteobacteria bacterium]